MQQQEAIQKISEIHQVIGASNRVLFSGANMILIGFVISLIPAIEYLTLNLSFGIQAILQSECLSTLVHTVFYWGLIYLVLWASPFKEKAKIPPHPLIQKAFSIIRPFLFALAGVIFAFAWIDQYQLIYPVILILMGLLFAVYGSFSIPAISIIAYSYVLVGVSTVVLSNYDFPNLWIFCVLYHGISYIVMGLFLRNAEGKTA